MVESTYASSIHPVIQTSTIILWTELFPKKRREKIQGEILQSIFEWCFHKESTFYKELQELQCFHTQSSNSKFPQLILHTELVLLQEILQLQGSSRADHYKASSSDCSRVSKHSTQQNKAPGFPTAFQGHTAQAGFQSFFPAETAFYTAGNIRALPTAIPRPVLHYRILPGEIGFFPKGQVLYIYAILRSVCSNLLIPTLEK